MLLSDGLERKWRVAQFEVLPMPRPYMRLAAKVAEAHVTLRTILAPNQSKRMDVEPSAISILDWLKS